METGDNAIQARPSVALSAKGFAPTNIEEAWRFAQNLAGSDIVPRDMYFKKPENCMIALDLASRMDLPWLTLMQHLYVVHGRPAMDSTLCTALVNRSGAFTNPIEYEEVGDDPTHESYKVRAYATRASSGKTLFGPWITWHLVKSEGWDKPKGQSKTPSKWRTMPDQMFHYRAASWFQRRYCPELTMGMMTTDEAQDIPPEAIKVESHEVPTPPAKGTAGLKEKLAEKKESKDAEPTTTTAEPEKTGNTGRRLTDDEVTAKKAAAAQKGKETRAKNKAAAEAKAKAEAEAEQTAKDKFGTPEEVDAAKESQSKKWWCVSCTGDWLIDGDAPVLNEKGNAQCPYCKKWAAEPA